MWQGPALNAALNTLAKERPDEPLAALSELLRKARTGAGADVGTDVAAGFGGGSGVMSADELAKKDAEELAAKQKKAADSAAAKDALEQKNVARETELAAQGKRAAGGMHKFDADEVREWDANAPPFGRSSASAHGA